MAVAHALYTPTLKRQIGAIESGGSSSAEYVRLAARAQRLGILMFGLVLVTFGLMVFRPRIWYQPRTFPTDARDTRGAGHRERSQRTPERSRAISLATTRTAGRSRAPAATCSHSDRGAILGSWVVRTSPAA